MVENKDFRNTNTLINTVMHPVAGEFASRWQQSTFGQVEA
jgi:hypothetical protein